MNCPEDGRQRFILLPALARKRFKSLLASQEAFTEASENSAYNKYFDAPNKDLGIITDGYRFQLSFRELSGRFRASRIEDLPVSASEKASGEDRWRV